MVGLGGVLAEVFKDVRLLPPDLAHEEIVAELLALKASALLRGFRGAPALDVAAAAELIRTVSELVTAEPRLREIDLNPVVAYPAGQGVLALDALIVIGSDESAPRVTGDPMAGTRFTF